MRPKGSAQLDGAPLVDPVAGALVQGREEAWLAGGPEGFLGFPGPEAKELRRNSTFSAAYSSRALQGSTWMPSPPLDPLVLQQHWQHQQQQEEDKEEHGGHTEQVSG